jgi:hypothetical protein
MQQDLEGLWLRERVCDRCWGWAHDAWDEGLLEVVVTGAWLAESELQTEHTNELRSKGKEHKLARYLADFMKQWGGGLDDHEDCDDLLCLCGCRVYRDKEGD